MNVYMVWHIRHAKFLDGSPTEHFGQEGEILCDEQSGDDVKLLGVYASEADAQGRVDRARSQPGFSEEPNCFLIDGATLGEDQWVDGFVSVPD